MHSLYQVQCAFQDLVFFGRKCFIIFFLTKKDFGKRRKRRERRGGRKGRQNKKRERERENRFISIFKSNLSKSTNLQIFNISFADEPRHLQNTKFQITAVLLIIVQCTRTHVFDKMQNVCRFKTGIFHTQQSGTL